MNMLRNTLTTLILFTGMIQLSLAQSSVDVLKDIIQTDEITAFFKGTFNHLGIEVAESNETLTLHHEGDKIRIEEGLNADEVDFVLNLDLTGIENLVKYTEDGKIDDTEATIIAKVFFTPFTRETMKNPVMTENRKRKAAGIEELIHVYLNFPDGKPAAAHTLIYAADQWVIVEGIVGEPKRVFKFGHEPALDYQRKVFEAIQTDTKKGWLSFVKWYKEWRKDYSEVS